MSALDDLIELDQFNVFKKYIKSFILSDETLFKIIFFANSNPLNESYPENPFEIFDEDNSNNNGVVIFNRKNNSIINSETVTLLIDFESRKLGNSDMLQNVYIVVRILAKGTSVQELENGLNRLFVIGQLFDKHFNLASVSNIGKVSRQSFNPLPTNEENNGYILMYKANMLSNRLLEEANT